MSDTNTHLEQDLTTIATVSADLQCNKCQATYPSFVNHSCVLYTQAELDKAVREGKHEAVEHYKTHLASLSPLQRQIIGIAQQGK